MALGLGSYPMRDRGETGTTMTTTELRFIPIREALKRCGLPESESSVRRFRRRLVRAERETGKSILRHHDPPLPTEVNWESFEQHLAIRRQRRADEWEEVSERLRLEHASLVEKVKDLEHAQLEHNERLARVTEALKKLASAMSKLARDG